MFRPDSCALPRSGRDSRAPVAPSSRYSGFLRPRFVRPPGHESCGCTPWNRAFPAPGSVPGVPHWSTGQYCQLSPLAAQLTRPPVDAIRNISPCIVFDQKRRGASSRSTVGTVTEIYTYLRMLVSRCGRPFVGWSHRFS